ncbi:FAD binding domain-containing protein [Paraphoma chrysanthemicola]|uniref:FAD binding domain-containing protein n=1 Tax=Paraphoma chrysanthemicola TaxID=798071 RepID=A0A8K0RJ80_9PLEO|nr:FAD binding domain-containing protein [Paraphoma chrysanthemicola]
MAELPEVVIPVLIIGTGPSGATLALLLAQMGIKVLAVSKHRGTANTPRAHLVNQRAMEVFRDAGLEEKFKVQATTSEYIQHISWLNTLNGEEYGRLWSFGNRPDAKGDYELSSPCLMSDLPQSLMEPMLVAEATNAGAEIRFSTLFVRLEQNATSVRTTLRDRLTGQEFVVVSKYLVGADGARSAVLQALNIPIIGRQLNPAFNVHIKADLAKYIAHRPGSLTWVLNTDAPEWSAAGNFRMVKPWKEFVVSMHPVNKDTATFNPTEDDIRKRLHQMIGDDTVDIEILSTFSWSINDQVAERWQDGRVFCIGDAAHRHPPINGLGSNTSISDAFNLSWKLAYVLKDFATPSLLDTLTPERKPVGDGIVRRANEGMEVHRTLWGLLGLDSETRKKTTDLLQASTAAGVQTRESLREILETVDDEVQAVGIQMNQVYSESSAVLVEPGDVAPDFTSLNALKKVKISTYPGYHLPHVWLAANGLTPKISSLDLCGKGSFTLFTGIGGEAWIQAAKHLSAQGQVQVRGITIGFRCDYIDCYRDWSKLRGVEETGAVLVRPDHFVAWRIDKIVEDPVEKLTSVLRHILGKHITSS